MGDPKAMTPTPRRSPKGKPVLYAHSTCGRGSILSGRPRRLFGEQWKTWEGARAALAEVRRTDRSFRFDDLGEDGGAIHTCYPATCPKTRDDANEGFAGAARSGELTPPCKSWNSGREGVSDRGVRRRVRKPEVCSC